MPTEETKKNGVQGSMFTLLLASAVLLAVGMATPAWRVIDQSGQSTSTGLFESCTCAKIDLNQAPAYHKAVVAFCILGVVGLVVSVLFYFMFSCCDGCGQFLFNILVIVASAAAALFLVIAVAVFAPKSGELSPSIGNLSYSFGLVVASGVLAAVAAFLSVIQLCCFGD